MKNSAASMQSELELAVSISPKTTSYPINQNLEKGKRRGE